MLELELILIQSVDFFGGSVILLSDMVAFAADGMVKVSGVHSGLSALHEIDSPYRVFLFLPSFFRNLINFLSLLALIKLKLCDECDNFIER